MKKAGNYAVRIVQPSDQPALPKQRPSIKEKAVTLLERSLYFLVGSGTGLIAGILIYFMLNFFGLNLGNVESTFVIGFPAMLGIFTALVIF